MFLQAHPKGYHAFDTLDRQNNHGVMEEDQLDEEDFDKLTGWPSPPPPGFADPKTLNKAQVEGLLVLLKGSRWGGSSLVRLGVCPFSRIALTYVGSAIQQSDVDGPDGTGTGCCTRARLARDRSKAYWRSRSTGFRLASHAHIQGEVAKMSRSCHA